MKASLSLDNKRYLTNIFTSERS